MAESTPRRRRKSTPPPQGAATHHDDWLSEVQQLSYQEARTALELAMAQLQSTELEVEEMANLYRRAEAYANRCDAVLSSVEQEVIQWDDAAKPANL